MNQMMNESGMSQINLMKEHNSQFKVIVEAGHIYVDEIPTIEHIQGLKAGAQLSSLLKEYGFQVENWLFIDNYNPQLEKKNWVLNLEEYKDIALKNEFSIDNLVMEQEMVSKAEENMKSMHEKYFIDKKGSLHMLSKKSKYGKPVLYNGDKDQFACVMLDASLYVEKLKQGDIAITVLPDKYAKQQSESMLIANKIMKSGIKTKGTTMIPVFTNEPIYLGANKELFYPELKIGNHVHPFEGFVQWLNISNKLTINPMAYIGKTIGPNLKVDYHG